MFKETLKTVLFLKAIVYIECDSKQFKLMGFFNKFQAEGPSRLT